MVKSKNDLQWVIMDVIRGFTSQSEIKLAKMSHLANNYQSLIVLVVFWLLFMTIITKCFSSLLLNMYFKQTALPLVETLEQILEDKALFVVTPQEILKNLLHFEVLNEEQVKLLKNRYDEYLEHIGNQFDSELGARSPVVFNDMINGLAVILLNSINVKTFDALYMSQSERYRISEHKYINRLAFHSIHRNSLIFDELRFA